MIVLFKNIWLQEGSWFFFVNDVHAQIQTCFCIASLSFHCLFCKEYDSSIRISNIVATFLERYFSVEFLRAWLRVTSNRRISDNSTQIGFGNIQMERPKSTSRVSMYVLSRYPLDRPSKSLRSEALGASKHTQHFLCFCSCACPGSAPG